MKVNLPFAWMKGSRRDGWRSCKEQWRPPIFIGLANPIISWMIFSFKIIKISMVGFLPGLVTEQWPCAEPRSSPSIYFHCRNVTFRFKKINDVFLFIRLEINQMQMHNLKNSMTRLSFPSSSSFALLRLTRASWTNVTWSTMLSYLSLLLIIIIIIIIITRP